MDLLNKYKEYEYILNTNKEHLAKELFDKESKASTQKIMETIGHYEKAHEEILNLSNDVVDFPLFRVQAGELKKQLAKQAGKIRDKLLQSLKEWCKGTTDEIEDTYNKMSEKIMIDPKDERTLVEIRDFIKNAPQMVDNQKAKLEDVYEHYCILDDFSFKYENADIETFWFLKQWPFEI